MHHLSLRQVLVAIGLGRGLVEYFERVVEMGEILVARQAGNRLDRNRRAAQEMACLLGPQIQKIGPGADSNLLAGASGGDFAFVRLDYVDDAQNGSYFYKDTGAGTMIN